MIWKIYFCFILVISIPLFLFGASGQSIELVIDLSSLIVLMLGLFGLAWNKKIFSIKFWQVYFPLAVIWNLGHAYFTFEGVSTIILTAIYIPTLIAAFLYAFKRDEIWSR